MNYEDHKEGEYTIRTYENGVKVWLLNDMIHREDGPAYEDEDGSKEWWLNDERHREDGPSYEGSDGARQWWWKDKLVYSDYTNNLKGYPELPEQFKRSIIKYELQRN